MVTGTSIEVRWQGGTKVFQPGSDVTIGRDDSNDIVSTNPHVSRRHATLSDASGQWMLIDEGSTQGLFVEGQRVASCVVDTSIVAMLGRPEFGDPLTLRTIAPVKPSEMMTMVPGSSTEDPAPPQWSPHSAEAPAAWPASPVQASVPPPTPSSPEAPAAAPPVADPFPAADMVPREGSPKRRGRVLVAIAAGVAVVVTIVAVAVLPNVRRAQQRSDYLSALDDAGRRDEFATDDDAVSSAKAMCKRLDEGAQRRGYERDQVGVAEYCSEFADGFRVIPTPEEQDAAYLKKLKDDDLFDQFANEATALANAKRVCDELDAGGEARGFERDAAAVAVYCRKYFSQFTVIPTPEEQQAAYLAQLRKRGLAGKFSSDVQAVAHAKSFCESLDGGATLEGLPEDKIAVQVYCPEFLKGFKVLRTSEISGEFILIDSDPSYYFPAIIASGGVCSGSGGYSDITPGTVVDVRNESGELLTQTSLELGHGDEYRCTFPFTFTVTEGEDQYVIEVSHRGSLSFSFTELDTLGVVLTLGS